MLEIANSRPCRLKAFAEVTVTSGGAAGIPRQWIKAFARILLAAKQQQAGKGHSGIPESGTPVSQGLKGERGR
ncbi:MAG TPA: hypothetical protein VD969_29200 [Symbiobacteriaceae bacterium]|nr:hypothetical protein [Symbiobacteriaceae bacterium]